MIFKTSCNQSGKVVYRVGWSLGSNTICPSDPGSILKAAGEAHGSDVPLENFRQDCHLRVRTEAVLSLGCYHRAERELGLLVSNSEPQAPSQPGPCSEPHCCLRLFLRILLPSPLFFKGVTPSPALPALYLPQAFP